MEEFIYVLQLQDGHIYIGRTKNIEKRIEDHKNGKGCSWTKLHPFENIILMEKLTQEFQELTTTLRMMKIFGIEKVRGDIFLNDYLSWEEKLIIKIAIASDEGKCFRCNNKGHLISSCPKMICLRCGRNNHFIEDCYAKTHLQGYPLEDSICVIM